MTTTNLKNWVKASKVIGVVTFIYTLLLIFYRKEMGMYTLILTFVFIPFMILFGVFLKYKFDEEDNNEGLY